VCQLLRDLFANKLPESEEVREKRHDDGGDGSGNFFVLEDELAERAHFGKSIVSAAKSLFSE